MTTYFDHNVIQDELFEGVPFTVIQTPGKAMVHFTTVVDSGFYLAERSVYELPHLLEHLAFEGNTTFADGKAMSIELDTAAVYHNAVTSTKYNWYDFSGPHVSLDLIQKHIVAQLYTPLFTEKAIDQQKQVIDNELHRKREEDGYRVLESIGMALWGDVASTIDERLANLPKITRDDILRFYKERYNLKNMHFVVCGDISDKEIGNIKNNLTKGLAKAPRGEYSPYKPRTDRVSEQDILLSKATASDVTSFEIRFYKPMLDDASLTARRVLRAYLAGGLGSVMQRRLREEGLTYGISTFILDDAEHSGFGFADKVPHNNVAPLVKRCVQFVTEVADGEIDKVAFDRAKGLIINSRESAFQRSNDFMGWYFSELQDRQPLKTPADYLSELEKICPQDLVEVARQYLSKDNSNWLLSVATQDSSITVESLKESLGDVLR